MECWIWIAPLPFRTPRQRLPNNRQHALNRLMSLSRTLKKNTEMKRHFIDFMEKTFENKHAEIAPPVDKDKECWYLPSFGVYHLQKPGQIRIVFDSSARFSGVSLNDVLLRGPDLNNSLLGVLMRFRTEPVAVMTDIQQMLNCFLVREDHNDYLCFLWFRNHQLDGEIVEYRMRVHVFGNCPSPAVAIYGLKRTAIEGENEYGVETTDAEGYIKVGLIFGKTKLAPKFEFTIPRLELCLAVLAVEIAEVISEELDLEMKNMKFFTDSKLIMEQEPFQLISLLFQRGSVVQRSFRTHTPVSQLRKPLNSFILSRMQNYSLRTNFIEAKRELQIGPTGINQQVENYLSEQGCTWLFNPLHSSHMGGSWERMIGVTRRILNAMFLKLGPSRLTHEVLTTLMAEVKAIVNSRPLTPVSSDPEQPSILTPAMLLTQKIGAHTVPPGQFDDNDIYRRQWRQVQHLANEFWKRWRNEYICCFQS
ncbi:hypothetical protein QQF64_024033 [Cirrhinus molitorella]|uniref:DUF5641 domain-containing protein n=1 Tax=Cirrhinus molitorella TaxID=172907 RepID=A0ABR3NLA9_9TELE